MAECFLIRSNGGGELYALPVLDANYPKNVTITASANGSATFQVKIATDGKPAEYKYQWYVDGIAVNGATSTSYTKTGLTAVKTYKVYCAVTNKAGTVESSSAILTVEDYKPSTSTFSYSGTYEIRNEGNYNWYIILKTGVNATLKFAKDTNVDIFAVGGGGGGGNGGGGGGGRVKTVKNTKLTAGTSYTVTIGAGGSVRGGTGGTSSFYNSSNEIISAAGGSGGDPRTGNSANGRGGDGGSGGGGACNDFTGNSDPSDDNTMGRAGAGGSNGGNGGKGNYGSGGTGLDSSTGTYAFGESTWYGPIGRNPYAGGGGGGNCYASYIGAAYRGAGGNYGGGSAKTGSTSVNGLVNTGGGGAGSGYTEQCGTGGSGVIIIRSAR